MKIEAGKYYRTRDGRKVGPMEITRWDELLKARDGIRAKLWNKCDGTHGDASCDSSAIKNMPHLDLISEWEDEPDTDYAALAAKYGIKITVHVGKLIVEYDGRK